MDEKILGSLVMKKKQSSQSGTSSKRPKRRSPEKDMAIFGTGKSRLKIRQTVSIK